MNAIRLVFSFAVLMVLCGCASAPERSKIPDNQRAGRAALEAVNHERERLIHLERSRSMSR